MGSARHRSDAGRRKSGVDPEGGRESELAREADAFRAKWKHTRRRRGVAYLLLALAAVVISTHVLEHAGVLRLLDAGLEDLLLGYPMAFLLLITGAIALGPE